MNNIELSISIISASVATAATIISRIQLKESKKFTQMNSFMILMEEYRSDKFIKIRLLAKELNFKEYSEFTKEEQNELTQLSHFFDTLGILVWNKFADKEVVSDFIGGNIRDFWYFFNSIIKERRKGDIEKGIKPNPRYQTFFEYLATGKHPKKKQFWFDNFINYVTN